MKNAELDALVTALSFLRRIYSESTIGDKGGLNIQYSRWPRVYRDLLNKIGKLERIIASSYRHSDEVLKDLGELFQFYQVDDLLALIHAQNKHIESLQAKLPKSTERVYTKVRA